MGGRPNMVLSFFGVLSSPSSSSSRWTTSSSPPVSPISPSPTGCISKDRSPSALSPSDPAESLLVRSRPRTTLGSRCFFLRPNLVLTYLANLELMVNLIWARQHLLQSRNHVVDLLTVPM